MYYIIILSFKFDYLIRELSKCVKTNILAGTVFVEQVKFL